MQPHYAYFVTLPHRRPDSVAVLEITSSRVEPTK
jgi:hypothetical protein